MKNSELLVLMKLRDYLSCIYVITEKSPKKYRNTLSQKLENYALEALVLCVESNEIFVSKTSLEESYKIRIRLQNEALAKLRVSGYLLQIAQEIHCILLKQFERAARLLNECIQILVSWKNSEMRRLREANNQG